jgi:hypothetical protein
MNTYIEMDEKNLVLYILMLKKYNVNVTETIKVRLRL